MKSKLLYLFIAIMAISFNSNALPFPTVKITGSGVGGWTEAGIVTLTTTDGVTYTKANLEIVGSGGGSSEIKFTEGTWATAVGVATGTVNLGWPSGTAVVAGAMNIGAVPGFWNVTFNYTTKVYAFTPGVNPDAAISITGTALPANVAMSTTNGEIYAKESVTFVAGSAKFLEVASPINPTPTANWSSIAFPTGTGTLNGVPIPVTAGTFYVYFYKSTGTYSFDPTVVSIIGAFNTWLADVDLTTTNDVIFTVNHTFATATTLKFRDNHNWNFNFGSTTNPSGFPSGTGTMAGATDIAVPAGNYNITFNRSTLAYSFVDTTLGVDIFSAKSFTVYPNPSTNNWNISSGSDDITSVKIVDVLGKTVYAKNTSSKEVQVNASNLNKGTYFAKISTANGAKTVKLMKN